MRVLIVDATGAFGSTVVACFLARGDEVRVIVPAIYAEDVPNRSRVEIFSADGCGSPLEDAAADVDVACDLGVRPGAGDFATLWSCSLVAEPELVDTYVTAGVRRVVLVSSVAVYRPALRRTAWPLRESAPVEPHGDAQLRALGRANIAAEQALRGAVLDHVILRTPSIYGSGIDWTVRVVERIARARPAGRAREHGPVMQWVHVRDVSRAIVLAATCATGGGTFNIAGAQAFSSADLLEGRRAGWSWPRVDSDSLKYDLTKARSELGFTPEVALGNGLREVAAGLEHQVQPGG